MAKPTTKSGALVPRNRRTVWSPRSRLTAREAIAMAAEKLGGVERLVEWVREDPKNEQVFWAVIYPKLIVLDIKVEAGERLARALAWRPPT